MSVAIGERTQAAVTLRTKIEQKTARAGVIGLGYVGLPLATELGRAGFDVVGIDKSPAKIQKIARGDCYIRDIEPELFERLLRDKKISASTGTSALASCDTVSICVPTPLRKTKDPDMSYVVEAAEALAAELHPGMLIVLESTTYPGTTEEIILPLLERRGMKVGEDFFLCFSPERVDPGNARFKTRDIPKVIGGVTPACTELGALYYSQVMNQVVPVSSTHVAEMVKLLENTFRMINIGLVNEMAIMCDKMGINVWEVIEAAATKPFGFMPFYPGPGLGGHCIPVDPHYLSWKTRQVGYSPRFIDLASEINGGMPEFVVHKVQDALNDVAKPVKGSRVHVLGVAYKRDIDDMRESPAVDIIALLEKLGAEVSYTDSFVPELRREEPAGCPNLESQPLELAVREADCVVIITDHSDVDYARVVELASRIVDSRNALKGFDSPKIVRL